MSSAPNYQQPSPIATRTSKAAVASLVFGILSCIPVITSPIAIITGFIGISATGKPGVKGRPMAIIGLILGFIGIVWSIAAVALGGAAFWGYGKVKEGVALVQDGTRTTNTFVTDLASGNVEGAPSKCTSNVSREDLTKIHDQLTELGEFKGINARPPELTQIPGGGFQANVSGTATFEKGVKQVTLRILQEGGVIKVDRVDLTDVP